MQKSSAHLTTITILLSILTITVQFCTYYFFGAALVTFGLTSIIILLFSHILLEQFMNYESCFSYILLNLFISFLIILLSYYGGKDSILTYTEGLLLFIILNWAIPVVYCIFRCLFDRGPKYSQFNLFYRNISIVFVLFYAGVLIYLLFTGNTGRSDMHSINFAPFVTIATRIEDFIEGQIGLGDLVPYFTKGIVLYIPYGFYTILLLRYFGRLTRTLSLFILPLLVEVIQSVFQLGKGDIDDVILAFIGGFLGALCYHILNTIFRSVTDEDFLSERSSYSFYGNSLHF